MIPPPCHDMIPLLCHDFLVIPLRDMLSLSKSLSEVQGTLMTWKEWLSILQFVFAFLLAPALGLVIKLLNRQSDQKAESTLQRTELKAEIAATNVQVEQVKTNVAVLGVKMDSSLSKMDQSVTKLDDTLREHGKSLSRIEGFLSGTGKIV